MTARHFLLGLTTLGLVAAGCERSDRSSPSAGATPKIGGRGMNVLFVSVDTTRADCLGCYGHPVVKTPHIDRLATEGTRFAQCMSPVPLTLPAHSSMMTGSYPFVHGARDNGGFVLGPENITLAEIFKQAGYATHAEVGAVVLNRRYGLSQGFDTYGDLHRREGVSITARKQAAAAGASEDPAPAGLGTVSEGEGESEPEAPEVPMPWSLFDRKADDLTRCGIELLKRNTDHPFFIFLHYFDPHQAYEAPERFAQQYPDGYLAEIAFFDEQFGQLMEALRELGLAEKTLVVLTSDHGEGRGQHGEQTHSYFVYDSTLHVPLILWCPGQVPAGQVVETQVRLIDLAPTVLEWARLEKTPQTQGTCLLPLLADPKADRHLPCYADSPSGQIVFGYSMLRALRDRGWKYILSPAPELYDVAEDPLELINLAGAEPERAADMREELRRLITESPPPPGSRAARQAIDPEELRKLQALGYVTGGSGTGDEGALTEGSELDHFEPTGPNPRDKVEPIELMNRALGGLLGAKYEEAEKLYRRLLELEPNNPKATKELADTVAAQKRIDEAVELYRAVLEVAPADMFAHLSLGRLLLQQGALEEAETEFRQAVKLDPTYHIAHLQLGSILSRRGRFEEALVEYAAAAELAPDIAVVPLQWGIAFRALGRMPEAEAQMRRACEMAPDFALARLHLAYLLGLQARRPEAIRELLTLLEKQPQNVAALEMLAAEYTKEGDYAAAQPYYRRAAELGPEGPRTAFVLGLSLALEGRWDEAIAQYRKTLQEKPDSVMVLLELGRALEKTNRLEEALQTYGRLQELAPKQALVYPLFANLLDQQGQAARAIEVLRQGHTHVPTDADILNDLAWRLATSANGGLRSGAEAVTLAEQSNTLTGGTHAGMLDTLAAAYAEAGRFDDASATVRRALESANRSGDPALAQRIAARLALYEKRQPYHEQ